MPAWSDFNPTEHPLPTFTKTTLDDLILAQLKQKVLPAFPTKQCGFCHTLKVHHVDAEKHLEMRRVRVHQPWVDLLVYSFWDLETDTRVAEANRFRYPATEKEPERIEWIISLMTQDPCVLTSDNYVRRIEDLAQYLTLTQSN